MLMLLITDCRRKPGQYVWSGCDPERQRARRIQARTPFSKRALLHGGINIGGKKIAAPSADLFGGAKVREGPDRPRKTELQKQLKQSERRFNPPMR